MNDTIFYLFTGLVFAGAERLPNVSNTVTSFCSFGVSVTPIIERAKLRKALKLSDDELSDAIDYFHEESTLSINEHGQWLAMEYTGACFSRSLCE